MERWRERQEARIAHHPWRYLTTQVCGLLLGIGMIVTNASPTMPIMGAIFAFAGINGLCLFFAYRR